MKSSASEPGLRFMNFSTVTGLNCLINHSKYLIFKVKTIVLCKFPVFTTFACSSVVDKDIKLLIRDDDFSRNSLYSNCHPSRGIWLF